MERNRSSLAIGFIGGAAAAVLLSGTAIAATGGNMIIGRANHATTKTALFNPNGTALELQAHGSYPPLLVGRNRQRVPHLNVDLIDGLDSADFQRVDVDHIWYYGAELVNGFALPLCPPGASPLGGGVLLPNDVGSAEVRASWIDYDEQTQLWGWMTNVVGDASYTGDGFAVVTCYHPEGNFPPQVGTSSQRLDPAEIRSMVRGARR